ncbi:MAG: excinuclease ABC subunit UvrA [Phycisphaerae bacterium]|nr:excinuclease ABC subunit UvrA [Phycisphaerae bacterium]
MPRTLRVPKPIKVEVSAEEGLPQPRRDAPDRFIRVRGAKEHNLKNIDVEIPRDRLVVITGLSGSGKSSLAFDTLFAEGQRKYMESLSAYARQFLDQLKKPDVEEIEGIPPTIAIEQRSASSNPRSTVATTTEIYDYLRLLFARCGTPVSWAPTRTKKDGTILARAGTPITATSASQIVDAVMALGVSGAGATASRIHVLAPVIRGQKGFHRDTLERLQAAGWQRARVNGEIVDLRDTLRTPGENPLKLGRYEKHSIDAVIDRLAISGDDGVRQRLAESVEAALKLADGSVIVASEGEPAGTWIDRAFSDKFADPERPEFALPELSPRLFSFNSPFGACPTCHGLGTLMELDEARVVPDLGKSLHDGAIVAYHKNSAVRAWFHRSLKRFCKAFGLGYDLPLVRWPAEATELLLRGPKSPKAAEFLARILDILGGRGGKAGKPSVKWKGVLPELQEWMESTDNPTVKEWLGQFLTDRPCPTCHGDRLRIEALHVLLRSTHAIDDPRAFSTNVIGRPAGSASARSFLNIAELSRLTITDAVAFVAGLQLSREQGRIAEPIVKEVKNRLRFLASVGLEYLSLDRRTATLSGGEAQRIRLATQVGSGLVGACYVLDEPTIGLHQRDNARLIRTLRHLTDIGNSVLVVEHDEDMIRSADHVLDIGPGPGVHGGRVVAQGRVEDICAAPESITGAYLSKRRAIDVPARRRTLSTRSSVVIKGAAQNNLKSIDAVFPLGGIVCVTGVSGSGKSTLVNDILLQAARNHLLGTRETVGKHDRVTGLDRIDRIIEVDQSPIGRTPRSNPATYTGFFDDIRKVFAQSKEAKIRGYEPGRFSFNVKGGRCEACQGQGVKKIEMHFLPDVYVECEVCEGRRYNRETLEVLYRGKSIADVLKMTVEAALGFFDNHPNIKRFVQCLHDVGLDYLELGQPSTTLSGGEAQRIKLATELGKSGGTRNMPTVGLSPAELARAKAAFASAREGNHSDGSAEVAPRDALGAPRRRGRPLRSLSPYGHTLYVLDEPTTGLHFEDIRKLVGVFDRLADAGNTLVVIEHNLDVIKRADWIIDLGPEGGDKGGMVVAAGTPEAVAASAASHTGAYLRQVLRAEAVGRA